MKTFFLFLSDSPKTVEIQNPKIQKSLRCDFSATFSSPQFQRWRFAAFPRTTPAPNGWVVAGTKSSCGTITNNCNFWWRNLMKFDENLN